MNQDVACGACGAVTAYDPGCAECRVPPESMEPTELRRRREALNLTQAQLAERLKIRQHHLSRWETGAVPITEIRAAWLDRELSRLEASATAQPLPHPRHI